MSNQTERVDHLAAALRYASQGVRVFPLATRSKFPLISAANDGHGLHDATTDAAWIQAWWMAHPTANIGLRTGVAFDVIDLDSQAAVDALESARADRERISGPSWQRPKAFTTSSCRLVVAIGQESYRAWTFVEQAGTSWRRPRCIHPAFAIAGSSVTILIRRRHGWLIWSGRSELSTALKN